MNKKNNQSPDDLLFETLLRGGMSKEDAKQVVRDSIDGENRRLLKKYQGALSYWAANLEETRQRVVVTLDGRDTAGKGSNIKRVTEQLDHRRFGVTAFPGIPSPEEKFEDNWFQRYEALFPKKAGVQFFDRSWYNRAGVEAAMSFCTREEYEWFMTHVNDFERERIVGEGYDFLKIYLSIGKETQKERLKAREDWRKQWKSSPVDARAQEKWGYYTEAKKCMLEETDTPEAPWIILDSTQKHASAIEIMSAIISTNREIREIVETDMSLDLSPDPKIRRTASQELARMSKLGQIPTGKTFKFAPSR